MTNQSKQAPGSPGHTPHWTSSAKSGICKAVNALSNVSVTISHGILNEIYYPREDEACTREMELIVSDGKDFFSEEKWDTAHATNMVPDGIPAYQIVNKSLQGRYRIEKKVIADPLRDTVLQKIRFVPLKGSRADYHLYVRLVPHLGNQGAGNTAWTGNYKGTSMLFAARNNLAVALCCSEPWIKRSVGFVGVSDGLTDIRQHKQMTWEYQRAENGNVAMVAEIDLSQEEEEFTLALGFGRNHIEAGHHALASITSGFDSAYERYVAEWQKWQKSLSPSWTLKDDIGKFSSVSSAILRMHESKRFVGGTIASMSIPWGFSEGDSDIGGYHLVWPRDLVEAAGGFLALHSTKDALRIINYLAATQEADGHWAQNMWIEGRSNWKGIQMDQTALPILLIDLCRRHHAVDPAMIREYWRIVKKAVAFLTQNGPYSQMDRWEEEAGLTSFTLATEIAALLSAADFAESNDEPDIARYCRQTADHWNDHIEHWTYVTGTSLAKEVGVDGYYIRINPTRGAAEGLKGHIINLKNHTGGQGAVPVNELVSVDVLALVRFGLRAADDPRILDTIKVIDAKLKVDTPYGPGWHRYNNDGYGEHGDGSPYDGSGIGRVWPLLTGERAHYEIAAGNFEKAAELLKTMESFASHGLFSEQVWDTRDIPERELLFGKHSGSAMPLVWAHAEYIKLCTSLKQKKVFDMPDHTGERYIQNKSQSGWEVWSFEHPCHRIPDGKYLRVELRASAVVHWSVDGWKTSIDTPTSDTGLGVHVADLKAPDTQQISFTFYWQDAGRWENKDFKVHKINP